MTPLTMRRLRQTHNYVGVFFAPAIIFFAFTGALQTFSLHENHGGGPYKPPGWIVAAASLHKDQRLPTPRRAPLPESHADHAPARAAPTPPSGPKPPSPLPLKIFVLLLAIGLMGSALAGIVIALMNKAARRTTVILLILGALVPPLLLLV
jgi:hypothetical protein